MSFTLLNPIGPPDTSWREPVEVADITTTVLPTETPGDPITVDGEIITNTQTVLFTALSSGDNNIYTYDQPNGVFVEESNLETEGDTVYVRRGTYAGRRFFFDGSIWETNDSIITNSVIVQQDPGHGQFDSIKDAVDSITTASASNPFIVEVGPGIYIEDTITMKPFVSVIGMGGRAATTIEVDDTSKDAVIASPNSFLSNFRIRGATDSGKAALVIGDTASATFVTRNITFSDNAIHIKISDSATAVRAIIDSVAFLFTNNTERAVEITGSTFNINVTLTNILTSGSSATSLTEAVFITGSTANLDIDATFVTNPAGSTANGFHVQDGATVTTGFVRFSGFEKNLITAAVGAAPTINIIDGTFADSITRDISLEHSGTTGSLFTEADRSKIFFDPGITDVATFLLNPTSGGTTLTGSIFIGNNFDNSVDSTDLILGSDLGLLGGGELTAGAGAFDVDIEAGAGYREVSDFPDHEIARHDWSADTLTIPANSTRWIFVGVSGTPSLSASRPSLEENIILGRATTDSTGIEFIETIPTFSEHAGNKFDFLLRDAIGPIYNTGSIVSENTSNDRELDVTSGIYFLSQNRFEPAGGTSVEFIEHFHSGGTFTTNAGVTVVDNTMYDDETDLTSLTSDYYAKHALYLVENGGNEVYLLVYAQAEYEMLVEVEAADLPTPPTFFEEGAVVLIASIIVQEGNTNIVQVRDERPVIGFKASGVSASATHGNLLGLAADDHPQYLLVDGTRAMSGNLDMGSNNVVSVGTVDGVDVSSHASRHLPLGADPLSTASAVGLSPSSVNAEGIANTLSRSDHTHEITGFQEEITWEDENVTVGGGIFTTINFTGSNVEATDAGAGQLDVTISGGNSFETITTDTNGPVVADSANDTLVLTGATGITIDGTAASDTITISPANDLAAVEGLGTTGLATRTGSETWATRTLTGTASQITVSNGDGVSGNPTLSVPSAFIAPGSVQVTTTLHQPIATTVTAAGTTQGTATAISARYNVVTTTPASGGVILPAPTSPFGREIYINNRGANPLNVYPNTGGTIGTGATNAPIVIPVNQRATFASTSTTQWNTTLPVIVAGTGITVTPAAGNLTIASSGNFPSYAFYADQLDNPNNSDWTVNALAPAIAGPTNAATTVRAFDDTTQEGVGFIITVPSGATNITFTFKSRARTSPPAARTVGLRLYRRQFPDNAAVTAWSSALTLTNIDIPTNLNVQYDSQTISLATLGLTAGNLCQFELTRLTPTSGTNLVGDWLLMELGVQFS